MLANVFRIFSLVLIVQSSPLQKTKLQAARQHAAMLGLLSFADFVENNMPSTSRQMSGEGLG
ncbi:MAG: hypothetical protein NTX27_05975 [Verrucomicrobia bacterium]|jgi:hypothetical protein|nr:hypothetical protein [Verrucomicrobiota bacterium]